jgi:hypothetical protein
LNCGKLALMSRTAADNSRWPVWIGLNAIPNNLQHPKQRELFRIVRSCSRQAW